MKDFVIETPTQDEMDAAQKAVVKALNGIEYLIAPAIFFIDYSELPTMKIGKDGLPKQDYAGVIAAQGFRAPLRIFDDEQVPTEWPKNFIVRDVRDGDVRFAEPVYGTAS